MSLTFTKYNEELAKRVLSKGATIPVACKILGNYRLSQSKTKKQLGLDKFMYAGRPSKGRARIFYSADEMSENDVVYPINEMNNFNSRLADELKYFHLFGYAVKDIEYEKHHRIARVLFTICEEDNSYKEFPITFLDLSEVRYLKISADAKEDRNLFILPSPTKEDLDSIAVAEEQKALLKLPVDDFSVVVATIVADKEYYETNDPAGRIFDTHSFLKRKGSYEQDLLRWDVEEAEALVDVQLLNDNKKAQLEANGFAIADGRISKLSEDNSEIELKDYYDWLNDHFNEEFVLANRYFDRRYSPNLETEMVDSVLDRIATTISDKDLAADTFAEFEFNGFGAYLDYLEEAKDKEGEEQDDEGTPAGVNAEQFASLFGNKVQDEKDSSVGTSDKQDVETPQAETKADDEHVSDEAKASAEKDEQKEMVNVG